MSKGDKDRTTDRKAYGEHYQEIPKRDCKRCGRWSWFVENGFCRGCKGSGTTGKGDAE